MYLTRKPTSRISLPTRRRSASSARYLVRGGKCEVMEGKARSRIVVLEFPSYDGALACYHSPGYRAAKEIRAGKAEADVVIVEGYDGAKF